MSIKRIGDSGTISDAVVHNGVAWSPVRLRGDYVFGNRREPYREVGSRCCVGRALASQRQLSHGYTLRKD